MLVDYGCCCCLAICVNSAAGCPWLVLLLLLVYCILHIAYWWLRCCCYCVSMSGAGMSGWCCRKHVLRPKCIASCCAGRLTGCHAHHAHTPCTPCTPSTHTIHTHHPCTPCTHTMHTMHTIHTHHAHHAHPPSTPSTHSTHTIHFPYCTFPQASIPLPARPIHTHRRLTVHCVSGADASVRIAESSDARNQRGAHQQQPHPPSH